MKLYIASGLKNYGFVIAAQNCFTERGVAITFDWASRYHKQLNFKQKLSPDEQAKLAAMMEAGVRDADALLLMMPAKRGAHVEFGIAVGCDKPVFVYNPDESEDISFYRLPAVQGVFRDYGTALGAVMDHLNGMKK